MAFAVTPCTNVRGCHIPSFDFVLDCVCSNNFNDFVVIFVDYLSIANEVGGGGMEI